MLTRPDLDMAIELSNVYEPAQRCVVNSDEIKKIRSMLQLEERTGVELQNARNTVVMLWSDLARQASERNDFQRTMMLADAMSAITHVIDTEKVKRGLPA